MRHYKIVLTLKNCCYLKLNNMKTFILKMQEYLNLSEVGDELHCWVYECKIPFYVFIFKKY